MGLKKAQTRVKMFIISSLGDKRGDMMRFGRAGRFERIVFGLCRLAVLKERVF